MKMKSSATTTWALKVCLVASLLHLAFPGAARAQLTEQDSQGFLKVDLEETTPSSMTPAPGGPLTLVDIEALREEGRQKAWTFTVGLNSATDRTIDQLCGLLEPEKVEEEVDRCTYSTPPGDLPDKFDWRILGGTAPIRDQGSCGSCWAFSALAPIESAILIKEGVEEDLSEQFLVSCTSAGSCGGGWTWSALQSSYCFLFSGAALGAVAESSFPYVASDVSCEPPYPRPYCIDSSTYVGSDSFLDVPYIKQAILEHGPVSTRVYVGTAFQAYTSGIFNAWAGSDPNHAVALVGWDDSQGANGVWILRNSWGSDWGESGYMRIEYRCSQVGNGTRSITYNPDCNNNGIPDMCDTSCDYEIPFTGVCADLYPNACGLAANCNNNEIPDECERDCNNNGSPDDCDIANGTSADNNANSLPDECEEDCNGNGIFDWDELQAAHADPDISIDIDDNQVIDECQDCDGDGTWDWQDLGRPHGLLMASRGTNLIRTYHPTAGEAVGSSGANELADPYGVVIGPNLNFLVTSSGDDRIVEFDNNGSYVRDLVPSGSGGLSYPTGLTFGPDGHLYVSSNATHSVLKYDGQTGDYLGEAVGPGVGGLLHPYDLLFGPNGNMFVSSDGTDSILEYDGQTGLFVRGLSGGTLNGPRGLALKSDGHLLTASYDTGGVVEFDLETGACLGRFTSTWPSFRYARGLAWGPNGNLFVSGYLFEGGDYYLRVYEYNGQTGEYISPFMRNDSAVVDPAGLAFHPPSPEDCDNNGVPDECDSFEDCNNNGRRDACDIVDGSSADCNENWIPDECPWEENDCNDNMIPDFCDLAEGTSQDCNHNTIPDFCDIGDVTSQDCNANNIPDECDLVTGISEDCNDNETPDECDLAAGASQDCNSNDILDECDLADGTSQDCDGNTVPDECQDTSDDCNSNGVWDACDIAQGISDDCNENNVPDECDIADGTSQDEDSDGIPDECQAITRQVPSQYATIQDAIDAAGDYDIVLVADGTYQGLGNRDLSFGGKKLVVRSANGPEASTIDAEGQGRGFIFENEEPFTTRVEGFTIANGSSSYGGGIYAYRANPTISNCVILGNSADRGGGIYANHSNSTISNCVIVSNSADYGGGIYNYHSSLAISNSTIRGNSANLYGGGVYSHGDSWMISNLGISNCIMWGDSAEGQGPEVYLNYYSLLTITYSDVAGGQAGVGGSGTLDWGNGSIDADPLFVAPAYGSYRILHGSPCIDAGDNDVVPADVTTDLEGNSRFIDDEGTPDTGNGDPPIVDMGSYEFNADCNANGVPDGQDISEGTSEDCDENGNPDECEWTDCNGSGILDTCDIIQGISADCNSNNAPDECDLTGGTSADCNNNEIPDECDLGSTSIDCNGNGVPDECDVTEGTSEDCNENMAPDECEVATGTSEDCDGNEEPDECQDTSEDCNGNDFWDACDIAYGTSADCQNDGNGNGIPDECDIASGTSMDRNENGIPDECELLIISSDPPDGAIDARSPAGPDGVLVGWQFVILTFSSRCTELLPADLAVTEDGGDGAGPAIESVWPTSSHTIVVVFSEPLEVETWTTITHNDSGSGVRLGYLPGDVDGSGISNANDIIELIDTLMGMNPRPEYQTDINRSGHTDATDVTALIDLLQEGYFLKALP